MSQIHRNKKDLDLLITNLKVPQDITKQIINFRDFLNASWPFLDKAMKDHDWDSDENFIDDWLQVNWEFFLERELLKGKGFLTELSVMLTGRITKPEALANYTVLVKSDKYICDIKNQKALPFDKNLRLYSFSSLYKNGGYGLYQPFDLVDLVIDATKELFIVPIADLKFYLVHL